MLVSGKKIYVETISGSIIPVSKLPIGKTEEFRNTLIDLNKEVEDQKFAKVTFEQGYKDFPLFRHLIDTLFNLCGLKAEDFDAETAANMVFPHELPDGSYNRQGILTGFILGIHKDSKAVNPGVENIPADAVNAYARTLGNLWASFSELSEVLDIVSNIDYENLNEILKYRSDALKPAEEKNKEKSQELAKAAAAKLSKAGKKDVKIGEEINLGDLM